MPGRVLLRLEDRQGLPQPEGLAEVDVGQVAVYEALGVGLRGPGKGGDTVSGAELVSMTAVHGGLAFYD